MPLPGAGREPERGFGVVGCSSGLLIFPMFSAIKAHIARHALVYIIAFGLGLQAFGTGFYDNFWPIEREDMAKLGWWQIAAAFLKSCSFAIGIVVGYLIKGPAASDSTDSTAKAT